MPIVLDGIGDPASTLVLNRLWLNSVAEPADLVSLRIESFSPARTAPGEVRTLANGRLRLVRRGARPSSNRSMTAAIRRPTREQLDWLDEHLGELVTVRDPDGGKWIGVYLDLGYDRPVEGADMTLNLSQVTGSEAV